MPAITRYAKPFHLRSNLQAREYRLQLLVYYDKWRDNICLQPLKFYYVSANTICRLITSKQCSVIISSVWGNFPAIRRVFCIHSSDTIANSAVVFSPNRRQCTTNTVLVGYRKNKRTVLIEHFTPCCPKSDKPISKFTVQE